MIPNYQPVWTPLDATLNRRYVMAMIRFWWLATPLVRIWVLLFWLRLERAGILSRNSPISFLSLGHVVPFVSFLPAATELRSDLKQLGNSDAVTWVDVTAPGDGCSFALCDPVAVSGQGDGTQNGPLVLSAAFTQTLSDARWRVLRWRFFRLHFQYLCAFDQPGFYDYFQITAGPHSLRDRFQDRAPSPSRIVAQTTRYGGVQ